jgi:rhamnose utilization protein RhaD (predicted bifunctional aldolase and dehydrogenase)
MNVSTPVAKEQDRAVAAVREALLALSRALGEPGYGLAILGEGNTSAAVDAETFLVKASGTELATLRAEQLVQVRYEAVLAMLDADLDQAATRDALLEARVDPGALKPSVETAFHAWLLRQEGVRFVGHTHPEAVNQILCSDRAGAFAHERRFPDEIVYCGPRSLLIEYVDPGAVLAAVLRDRWQAHVAEHGFAPKVVLLQNHGLIATGPTPTAVLATTRMAVKAATIFAGACGIGRPVAMPPAEVDRIHNRLDEHYRQKIQGLR